MPRITEPAKSALENSTSREAVVGDQNDALSIKHKKQSQVLAAGDVDNRIQNGEEKVDAIALSTITPETGVAKPPATNKKTSKQFGKKRKNVYMGPYWDDEAGSLPTSAGADDVDFDSLLSQVSSSTYMLEAMDIQYSD
ncbi:hypothetical protein GGI25_000531 [Coemansia spiralis]|uniref:Uncharacterized protein n=2 Tax=Coemansia TaxID=4863 RepID=A0A9W8GEJ5_9FUNG|nr:hypothetical protein EDC05_000359 [Coemansia umbellata]KAJ2625436.1 hypothetical protein GGI26_000576 [Coemansia sp. RSA 1358]KAJ2680558.1 hypothetical protein GGI25_000531 [Coemansia spiralis]